MLRAACAGATNAPTSRGIARRSVASRRPIRPSLSAARGRRLSPAALRPLTAATPGCGRSPPRADPVELAGAQQHAQLAAGALQAHRGQAALLEGDPGAGEVVDDLAEVRLVADHEHALVGPGGGHERQRVVAIEALRQLRVLGRLDPELGAGQKRGVAGAHAWAREREMDLHAQGGQRPAGGPRLVAPALGELALGVVGARVVRLGLAVSKEPQLLRHRGAEPYLAGSSPGIRTD